VSLLSAAHSFRQVPLLAAAAQGISSRPAATTSTSCCLDPSRQFHRTGKHAGRQNQQLERRPAISIILILVEMSSTKFNLFQHIFNLEIQFISTDFKREFQFISTDFNQEFRFISIYFNP
jgi:hypothetical protein